ncbi:MAG: hypothetical protein ACC742_01630 [Thermoanaerobaculales bacterium]
MIGEGRSDSFRARLLLGVALFFVSANVSAQDLLAVRQPAASAEPTSTEPAGRCLDGSQIVRLSAKGAARLMTDGFLAACDPAVSFDGKQILFAGKRFEDDRFQIWRMESNGANVVRITDDPGDATSPLWVGSLFHLDDETPTRRIAYLATGHGWADKRTGEPASALFTSDIDGGHPLRISFHLGSDLAPDVLANGRLVFAAWRAGADEEGDERLSLMALNNDGTDLMAFYDNHDGPPYPHAVRVGRDGRVYFVEADGSSPLGGGDLAYVTLRRPLRSRTSLATGADGAYLDPLPLAGGGLLASFRPSGRNEAYGLYRVDAVTGERLELVFGKPGFHILDAQELAPHAGVKGRSSVVDTSKETGIFFCISSHLTDRRGLEHLKAGGVSTLRVIEGVPTASRSTVPASAPSERILGEVPIENDGSFHIEVPSGVPVRFEILDERGRSVASQDSWTWVMPREWRGCIGCHEDREMVAPNTLAEAFVKPAVRLEQPEELKER